MHFLGSFRSNSLFLCMIKRLATLLSTFNRVSLRSGCLGGGMGDSCWPVSLDGHWMGDCCTMRKTKQ